MKEFPQYESKTIDISFVSDFLARKQLHKTLIELGGNK